MDNFLTATGTHKNNPTGAALATVATGIAITPVDPISTAPSEDYPNEKLFRMRQVFTKYTAFQPGDFLTVGSTTYAVRQVNEWDALDGVDTYYHLIVEE